MKFPAITRAAVVLLLLEELVALGVALALTVSAHGAWPMFVGVWVAIDWGPIGAVLGFAFPVPLLLRIVSIALGLGLFATVWTYRWRAKRNARNEQLIAEQPPRYEPAPYVGWTGEPLDYPVEAPGPHGMDVSRARAGYPVLTPAHPLDVPPAGEAALEPGARRPLFPWS